MIIGGEIYIWSYIFSEVEHCPTFGKLFSFLWRTFIVSGGIQENIWCNAAFYILSVKYFPTDHRNISPTMIIDVLPCMGVYNTGIQQKYFLFVKISCSIYDHRYFPVYGGLYLVWHKVAMQRDISMIIDRTWNISRRGTILLYTPIHDKTSMTGWEKYTNRKGSMHIQSFV
jgi:hypothetical protein